MKRLKINEKEAGNGPFFKKTIVERFIPKAAHTGETRQCLMDITISVTRKNRQMSMKVAQK